MNTRSHSRSSTVEDAPSYSQVTNPAITSYQVFDSGDVPDSLFESSVGCDSVLPPVDSNPITDAANEGGLSSQLVTPDIPTGANSVASFDSSDGIDLANDIGLEEPSAPIQEQEDVEVPMDLNTAVAVAESCSQTPGMRYAAGSSIHSTGYCSKKKLVIKNFLEGLKLAAPKYNAFLKRPSNVPEWFTYEPDEAVFVLLSPFELNKKKKIKILNEMLIDWVNGMVKSPSKKEKKEMKASSKWHSPSTLSTTIRSFLAATKEFFGWDFMVSDFKFDGGFNAFFKQLVDDRRKIDVSNGR